VGLVRRAFRKPGLNQQNGVAVAVDRLHLKRLIGEIAVMNTLLLASQIVCYGVGIVSASLNIATFVRRHRRWRHLRYGQSGSRAHA
jgi:hypothetical protein